jgi:hypothetical protein
MQPSPSKPRGRFSGVELLGRAVTLLVRNPVLLIVPMIASLAAEILSVGSGNWYPMITHDRVDLLRRYELSVVLDVIAIAYSLRMSVLFWAGEQPSLARVWAIIGAKFPQIWPSLAILTAYWAAEPVVVSLAYRHNGVAGVAALFPTYTIVAVPLGFVLISVFVISVCEDAAFVDAVLRVIPYVRVSMVGCAALVALACAEGWYAPICVRYVRAAALANHWNDSVIVPAAFRAFLSTVAISFFSVGKAKICIDARARLRKAMILQTHFDPV